MADEQNAPTYERLTPLMMVRLAAPHTWPGPSVLPTVFGGFAAFFFVYPFNPAIWCVLLALAVFAQSAVNTLNDYADFRAGDDTRNNAEDPSDAVLVYNNPNPKHVLILGIVYLCVAAACGVFAVIWSMSLLTLVVGVIGILALVGYSYGHTPISYLPLGELISGAVMGFLIPLGDICTFAGHTQTAFSPFGLFLMLDWPAIIMMCGPFFLGIALVMATQNACDEERDRRAGRHTLPVCIGHKAMLWLYRVLVIFWIAVVLHLSFWYARDGFFCCIVLLIFGIGSIRAMLINPLEPSSRGEAMGAVTKGNLFINGAFLAALMFSFIV